MHKIKDILHHNLFSETEEEAPLSLQDIPKELQQHITSLLNSSLLSTFKLTNHHFNELSDIVEMDKKNFRLNPCILESNTLINLHKDYPFPLTQPNSLDYDLSALKTGPTLFSFNFIYYTEDEIRSQLQGFHITNLVNYDTCYNNEISQHLMTSLKNLIDLNINIYNKTDNKEHLQKIKFCLHQCNLIQCQLRLAEEVKKVRLQKNPISSIKLPTQLDLNQITQLPAEFFSIAEDYLQEITTLSVWNSSITLLPPDIHKLIQLQTLKLNENNLTSLPREIMLLAHLKEIEVENNYLTKEELPAGFIEKFGDKFLQSQKESSNTKRERDEEPESITKKEPVKKHRRFF